MSWFLYRKKSTSSSSKTFLSALLVRALPTLPRFTAIRKKNKMSILFCIFFRRGRFFRILLGRSVMIIRFPCRFGSDRLERYQREHLEILPTSSPNSSCVISRPRNCNVAFYRMSFFEKPPRRIHLDPKIVGRNSNTKTNSFHFCFSLFPTFRCIFSRFFCSKRNDPKSSNLQTGGRAFELLPRDQALSPSPRKGFLSGNNSYLFSSLIHKEYLG